MMSKDVRGNQKFLRPTNPTVFIEIPHYIPENGSLLSNVLHLSLSLSALPELGDFSQRLSNDSVLEELYGERGRDISALMGFDLNRKAFENFLGLDVNWPNTFRQKFKTFCKKFCLLHQFNKCSFIFVVS